MIITFLIHAEPEMRDLIIVIPLLAAKWEDAAYLLGFETPAIESIKELHRGNPNNCCREMLKDWLEANQGVSPKTWSTLLNSVAEHKDLTKAVEDIQEKLKNKYIAIAT